MSVALIYGINGQDGSYLCELLLSKNYKVYGVIRRASTFNLERLKDVRDNENLELMYGDITDSIAVFRDIKLISDKHKQIEIYNLSAMSHVGISFDNPLYTSQVDGLAIINILEALKILDLFDRVKLYQASTSELYGDNTTDIVKDENIAFKPCSPYAIAKHFSHEMIDCYRKSHNLYGCCGILFNHSSPRRGENFILRKISLEINKWYKNNNHIIELGNLNAKRDIGHAKDYVEGMYLMLQQDKPDDYVLCTEKQYTIREFVEIAFSYFNKTIEWHGEGLDEVGLVDGNVVVKVNKKWFRPNEVPDLLGSSKKAKDILGWVHNYNIKELIYEIIENDLKN